MAGWTENFLYPDSDLAGNGSWAIYDVGHMSWHTSPGEADADNNTNWGATNTSPLLPQSWASDFTFQITVTFSVGASNTAEMDLVFGTVTDSNAPSLGLTFSPGDLASGVLWNLAVDDGNTNHVDFNTIPWAADMPHTLAIAIVASIITVTVDGTTVGTMPWTPLATTAAISILAPSFAVAPAAITISQMKASA